jgi:hypothetical protein
LAARVLMNTVALRISAMATTTGLSVWVKPGSVVGVPSAKHPYQVVEFDGHRLDIRLKVVVRDQFGFEHEFEIERV